LDYLTKYEDNFKKLAEYVEKNEPILKEKELQEKSQKSQSNTKETEDIEPKI
jgi:hypothetical protein